ncbi:hypothetical protein [Streptomyces sp. NPDC097619]|uniref:hypothetical protein n=1 Tax=Streptomyces sp. NPDC097619 TaxID=3157228 RepID=UPI00332A5280
MRARTPSTAARTSGPDPERVTDRDPDRAAVTRPRGGRPHPRPRRRRLVFRALAVVLALLLAWYTAETVAGRLIEHRVAEALRPVLGDGDVRLAGSGLAALARDRAERAHVTADDVRFGRFEGVRADLTLEDLRFGTEAGAAVGAVTGTLTAPADTLRAGLAGSGGPVEVTSVVPDPTGGTLRIGLGPGGALTASVRPALGDDGRPTFTLTGATLFGAPAPAPLTERVRTALADRTADAEAPAPRLTPTAVTVTAEGLVLTVRAHDLRPAAEGGRPHPSPPDPARAHATAPTTGRAR